MCPCVYFHYFVLYFLFSAFHCSTSSAIRFVYFSHSIFVVVVAAVVIVGAAAERAFANERSTLVFAYVCGRTIPICVEFLKSTRERIHTSHTMQTIPNWFDDLLASSNVGCYIHSQLLNTLVLSFRSFVRSFGWHALSYVLWFCSSIAWHVRCILIHCVFTNIAPHRVHIDDMCVDVCMSLNSYQLPVWLMENATREPWHRITSHTVHPCILNARVETRFQFSLSLALFKRPTENQFQ